jgi:hypothetical protein
MNYLLLWVCAFGCLRAPHTAEIVSCDLYVFPTVIILEWVTQSHDNVAYYRIERSTDGHDFDSVGYQIPYLPSDHAHGYNFIDTDIDCEQLHYRVAVVDSSGLITYSVTRSHYATNLSTHDYHDQSWQPVACVSISGHYYPTNDPCSCPNTYEWVMLARDNYQQMIRWRRWCN